MKQRNGRGFSSSEIVELWDRWQRGEVERLITSAKSLCKHKQCHDLSRIIADA